MTKKTAIVKKASSSRSRSTSTGEAVAAGLLGVGLATLGVALVAHEVNHPTPLYVRPLPFRRPRIKTVETRETDYWTGRTKTTITKEEHSPYCSCGDCEES